MSILYVYRGHHRQTDQSFSMNATALDLGGLKWGFRRSCNKNCSDYQNKYPQNIYDSKIIKKLIDFQITLV